MKVRYRKVFDIFMQKDLFSLPKVILIQQTIHGIRNVRIDDALDVQITTLNKREQRMVHLYHQRHVGRR